MERTDHFLVNMLVHLVDKRIDFGYVNVPIRHAPNKTKLRRINKIIYGIYIWTLCIYIYIYRNISMVTKGYGVT